MAQINQEIRARHWEIVLIQDCDFPPDLVPQIAYILAQDDIYGISSRSPAQTDFMGRAVDARRPVR